MKFEGPCFISATGLGGELWQSHGQSNGQSWGGDTLTHTVLVGPVHMRVWLFCLYTSSGFSHLVRHVVSVFCVVFFCLAFSPAPHIYHAANYSPGACV